MRSLFSILLMMLSMTCMRPLSVAIAFDASPLQEKASQALDQGRLNEALSLYRAMYDAGDTAAERCQALALSAGVLALYAGQENAALDMYDHALALGGSGECRAMVLERSALLLYESGRLEQARQRYAQMPESDMARLMLERIASDLEQGREQGEEPPPWTSGEPMIRVDMDRVLAFGLPGGGQVLPDRGEWLSLPSGEYALSVLAGEIALNGRPLGARAVIVPSGPVLLDGTPHAGELRLRACSGAVCGVLQVPMELYLEGVVAREMGADFPLEALKAQAVAARSYAAHLLLGSASREFDLSRTSYSQVYGGLEREPGPVRDAVAATRGLLLIHEGRPALSYYHSHSGGMLEDDAALWNVDYPFLQAGPDPESNRARDMAWTWSISLDALEALLMANGYDAAGLGRVRASGQTPSGRVRDVVVETGSRSITIPADGFRLMVGPGDMRSTLCTLSMQGTTLVVRGQGFGHGVGMSQWGAYALAGLGSGFEDILARYYPGTLLERRW